MEKNEPTDAGHLKVNKSPTLLFKIFIPLTLVLTGCASLYGSYFINDPLTAEEHNNLGVIYEREGKLELALREYKRASALDKELVTPIVNSGNVYFKLDKYGEAVKYYKKALKKEPDNIEAANNLASVYIERGENYEEGLSYLLSASGSQEHVPAYALDTLGVLYTRTGDGEKASKYLSEACKSASGDSKLKEEIKSHQEELGEFEVCE